MANTITLTSLAPDIYAAMDQVARELTGAITSVTINSSGVERASFGDTVQSFVTSKPTLTESYTPAMTIPNGDDQTIAPSTFALNKVANVRIPLTGETVKKLDNSFGADRVRQDLFAQAIRTIVNTIEANLCVVLKNGSSRAVGSAGTTPFGSNLTDLTLLLKILKDNGAPTADGQLSLVLDTAASAKLRQMAQLQKANEGGGTDLLRQGELLNLLGFSIKESAGVARHTKGTGTGYLVDLSDGYPAGTLEFHVDTGTGTIVAGDVITIADEPAAQKYVVGEGFGGDGDGDIALNSPGLVSAIANNKAVTIADSHTANIGLHKSAAELALRAPAQPYGGDAAVDRMTIADPRTGLTFEVAEYKGYGMAMFDITVFYGAKVWKSDFVATLLG